MRKIHLICNAHLDPVWLWRWQEGCTEALSTFRVAEGFTDEFPGFAFNHNEAILYQWVKENEPDLFERIQQKVKEGKWHIMGGLPARMESSIMKARMTAVFSGESISAIYTSWLWQLTTVTI